MNQVATVSGPLLRMDYRVRIESNFLLHIAERITRVTGRKFIPTLAWNCHIDSASGARHDELRPENPHIPEQRARLIGYAICSEPFANTSV
jgi:hypothetical protein